MKKMFSILLSATCLAGCVTDLETVGRSGWEKRRAQQEAKYIGQKLESMYPEYGVPKAMISLSNGGKFVELEHYRTGYQCKASVETNSKSIITKLEVTGQNGCVMP